MHCPDDSDAELLHQPTLPDTLNSDGIFVMYKASPTQFLVFVYATKLPFKQHLDANTPETELFHPCFCPTHLSWK